MTYAPDTAIIATPVGRIRISGDHSAVHRVEILADGINPRRADSPVILSAAEQLEAWFAGELEAFDVALAPAKTPRGQILRQGLVDVGYGKTMSYAGLAKLLGSSPRAIGQLCARNPFPILVPCHRILAAAGALGNYSAGNGAVTKQWLLDHEQHHRRK